MNDVVKWATAILGSRRFLASVVALGIVLRVVRFAANRSLWGDEAALALNVLIKPFSQLLRPLDFLQGAPSGYLMMQKGVTTLLGVDEYSLRLVALVSGIASLVLFAVVARRLLEAPAAGLAVFLFGVSERLVYYSSEVKQYSTDTAVATVLLLGAIAVGRRRVTAPVVAVVILVGSALVWFSHPALIVVPSLLLALLLARRLDGDYDGFRRILVSAVVIGMSAVLAYAVVGTTRGSWVKLHSARAVVRTELLRHWRISGMRLRIQWAWPIGNCRGCNRLGRFRPNPAEHERCIARRRSDRRHSHCRRARSLPV